MPKPRAAQVLALLLLAAVPAPAAAQMEISARGARITLGGRLHTQFAASSVEEAPSQFFHRRARLQADLRVSDFLDGRVEPDFAGGRALLQDAWARATFSPAFALSLGQFKRPFTLIDLLSASDLPLIEREGAVPGQACAGVGGTCSLSRLTQQLQLDGRDVGVRVEGRALQRVTWMGSLTNGQGANTADVNDGKSASGRVEVAAGPWRAGVFAALHDRPGPEPDEETRWSEAFGADLQLGSFRGGPHLLATLAAGENWRLGPADARFLAAQLMATWYFALGDARAAGVEPLLRLSWADPHRGQDGDAGLLLTPGLMLYVVGRNGVALNLDHYTPEGDAGAAWSLKVQSFLYF